MYLSGFSMIFNWIQKKLLKSALKLNLKSVLSLEISCFYTIYCLLVFVCQVLITRNKKDLLTTDDNFLNNFAEKLLRITCFKLKALKVFD